jgi:hypothetical protein
MATAACNLRSVQIMLWLCVLICIPLAQSGSKVRKFYDMSRLSIPYGKSDFFWRWGREGASLKLASSHQIHFPNFSNQSVRAAWMLELIFDAVFFLTVQRALESSVPMPSLIHSGTS